MLPKIGIPQNGWFIMKNLIKMDDLGVPLFSETHLRQVDEVDSSSRKRHRSEPSGIRVSVGDGNCHKWSIKIKENTRDVSGDDQ